MGRILCLDTSNQRVPRSAAFRPSPTLLIHFSTILPSSPRPGPFLSPSTILLSRSLRDRSSFKRRRRLQSPSFSLFSPRLTRASEDFQCRITRQDLLLLRRRRRHRCRGEGEGGGGGGRMQDERPESTLVPSNELRRRRRRRRFLTYCFGDGERTRPKRETRRDARDE